MPSKNTIQGKVYMVARYFWNSTCLEDQPTLSEQDIAIINAQRAGEMLSRVKRTPSQV